MKMLIRIVDEADYRHALQTRRASLAAITEIRDKLWKLSIGEASLLGALRELDAAIDRYTARHGLGADDDADSTGTGRTDPGIQDDDLPVDIRGEASGDAGRRRG